MLKYLKGAVAPVIVSLVALLGSICGCSVIREYGIKEGIDQAGHYLMGLGLTGYYLADNPKSCKAFDKTMNFAVWREFNQKSKVKQKANEWCRYGCRRDLKYWIKGSNEAVKLLSNSSCKTKVNDLAIPSLPAPASTKVRP